MKLREEFVRDLAAAGEQTATGSVLIPFAPGRPMQGQVVALGTVRMGVADDGESLCDPSVALAVRAAGRLASEL